MHAAREWLCLWISIICKVHNPCLYAYCSRAKAQSWQLVYSVFMQQQSGCGCGSALQGPRHLLRSIGGYGNVAVNRQQHWSVRDSYDWSSSFAAQFNLTISPQKSTQALRDLDKCLYYLRSREIPRACLCSLCPVVTDYKAHLHYVNIHREQQNLCSSLDNWFEGEMELCISQELGPNLSP